MKTYYNLAELISSERSFTFLLHKLLHSPVDEAFICVDKVEKGEPFVDIAFLRIPQKTLQWLEVTFNKGHEQIGIRISHYTQRKDERIWERYLDLNDDVSNETNLIETLTEKVVGASQIFVRNESDLVKYCFAKAPIFEKYPFLEKGHPEYSEPLYLALESKKALQIDQAKKHKPGYTAQVSEWMSGKKHDLTENMIKNMAYVSSSDCDRPKN